MNFRSKLLSGALLAVGPVAAADGAMAAALVDQAAGRPTGTTSQPQDQVAPPPDTATASQTEDRRPGNTVVSEEDIVVTGTAWRQLLEQPVPVTLYSAEDRNLLSAGTASELVNLTPSFIFTQIFGLNVRGVGRRPTRRCSARRTPSFNTSTASSTWCRATSPRARCSAATSSSSVVRRATATVATQSPAR